MSLDWPTQKHLRGSDSDQAGPFPSGRRTSVGKSHRNLGKVTAASGGADGRSLLFRAPRDGCRYDDVAWRAVRTEWQGPRVDERASGKEVWSDASAGSLVLVTRVGQPMRVSFSMCSMSSGRGRRVADERAMLESGDEVA